MAASKNGIRNWFERHAANGAEFMLVVCDTFDHDDYPVPCSAEEFADKYEAHDGKNMQRIMEVYDLSKDRETQLSEHRAFNLPPGEST